VDGEVTRFLIDNNQQQYAQVIEEYQTNGTVNTTYTHGWDLISQDDGTNRIYYQVDGLGSTRLMTGNNGSVIVEYDYDAYGNLTRKVGDADNNYLFAGEQFDEAVDGYYLRARYYDPNTGRFASVDPFEGYNNQPITLHDYLYAGVNPVNAIDPSGEVAIIGYAISAALLADCLNWIDLPDIPIKNFNHYSALYDYYSFVLAALALGMGTLGIAIGLGSLLCYAVKDSPHAILYNHILGKLSLLE
jgi:RHS repeat-associated protein